MKFSNLRLRPTAPLFLLSLLASTTLYAQQSLDGVLDAAYFSGSDMGAKINNAIAALPGGPTAPCGSVLVPASSGQYMFTTTIVKPRCVNLLGEGAWSTVLLWNSSTGTALIAADSRGDGNYPAGQVADLTLQGLSASDGAIGLYIGGDATGTMGAIDPSTNFGDHQNFNRVRILDFGTGVQWGNNSWSNGFDESVISGNGTGVYFPTGLPNSGESIVFNKSSIQNSSLMGINQEGYSFFTFHGGRCDFNVTCGTVTYASFYGTHFEQPSGQILLIPPATFQPTVILDGGEVQLNNGTGSDTDMFHVNSSLNPTFIMRGTFLLANHAVTDAVNWNGSGGNAVLRIDSLPYYHLGGNIQALTNATCNFWGCHINDGQSGTDYEGGSIWINGNIHKGSGSFTIDHPLDPAHKYLSHSFVESPDMMNVYNGNITTDKNGFAVVVFPAYFEALNRDFRYQLTAIGQFAEAIVANEVNRNRFIIRTSKPGVKVSWQVTGIRHDAYADAHRIRTEEAKPRDEQGHYLHPELFGPSSTGSDHSH